MRYLLAVLCAVGIVAVQALYGGAMRPVFALPSLLLVAGVAMLGLVGVAWRSLPAPAPRVWRRF